jgi:hypothetical protein
MARSEKSKSSWGHPPIWHSAPLLLRVDPFACGKHCNLYKRAHTPLPFRRIWGWLYTETLRHLTVVLALIHEGSFHKGKCAVPEKFVNIGRNLYNHCPLLRGQWLGHAGQGSCSVAQQTCLLWAVHPPSNSKPCSRWKGFVAAEESSVIVPTRWHE